MSKARNAEETIGSLKRTGRASVARKTPIARRHEKEKDERRQRERTYDGGHLEVGVDETATRSMDRARSSRRRE